MKKLVITLCLMLVVAFISARELFVDQNGGGDYRTISEAIRHAQNHDDIDIITISRGIYREQLRITDVSQELTIRSYYYHTSNADDIWMTCVVLPEMNPDEREQSVVTIYNCASPITLDGISITGGRGTYGVIEHNSFGYRGGGIIIPNENNGQSLVTHISNCYIYNNSATWGGGIFSRWATVDVKNCDIMKNFLYYTEDQPYNPKGGGMYCFSGDIDVAGTRIFHNRSYERDDASMEHADGNAAGLYWEYDCALAHGINISFCTFYGNRIVAKPDQLNSSALLIQKSVHAGELTAANVFNCTFADNYMYAREMENERTPMCSFGFTRYNQEDHLYNNIAYRNYYNYRGNDIPHERQISGVDINFVLIPIDMSFSCADHVFNAHYYLCDEWRKNIDDDPLYEDPINYIYKLRWNEREFSPCILSGRNSESEYPEDCPDMGAIQFEGWEHYYFRTKLHPSGINRVEEWVCFPVLNTITRDENLALNVFDGLWDPNVLGLVTWKTIEPGNPTYRIYYNQLTGRWENQNRELKSVQGYKITLSPNNPDDKLVECKGILQDPHTSINVISQDGGNRVYENWVGYFIPNSQLITDALGAFLPNVYSIRAKDWSSVRLSQGGPWFPSIADKSITCGDMIVMKVYHDGSFQWSQNGRGEIADITPVSTISISNFPNPFNPETTIKYNLPETGNVNIGIYNVKGQLVKTLVNMEKAAGSQQVVWNGMDENNKSCSSGIYFCKIKTHNGVISRKMILTK